MRNLVEIEDIDALRRRVGINDVELREQARRLQVGDHVKLTVVRSGEQRTIDVQLGTRPDQPVQG